MVVELSHMEGVSEQNAALGGVPGVDGTGRAAGWAPEERAGRMRMGGAPFEPFEPFGLGGASRSERAPGKAVTLQGSAACDISGYPEPP